MQAGERRSPLRALRVVAQMPRFKPLRLMSESKSVIGLNMLTLWDERGSLDDLIEPLRGWVEDGSLRPVVAREFRLDDGAAAHRYMHEREQRREGRADALAEQRRPLARAGGRRRARRRYTCESASRPHS